MGAEIIRTPASEYNYTEAYRNHGNMRYLADGESFDGVVLHDAAILAEYGVTQEEVGRSLRHLFDTLNTFLPSRGPIVNEPIPGVILTRQVFELGQEHSPYLEGTSSNIDWHVHTAHMSNGNKAYHPIGGPTYVSDMLPEMIEKLGFFEGNVFYGIDPHWAVDIHRLVQKYQPQRYEPDFTKEAWDSVSPWHRFKARIAKDILDHEVSVEEFLPGVIAHIAPGKIAPHGWDTNTGEPMFTFRHNPNDKRKVQFWALLEAEATIPIPPDANLHGYPLGKYCTEVKQGTNIARFFPYNDQQVG